MHVLTNCDLTLLECFVFLPSLLSVLPTLIAFFLFPYFACLADEQSSISGSSGSNSPPIRSSLQPWTFIVTSDDLESDDLDLDRVDLEAEPYKFSSGNESEVVSDTHMDLLSPPDPQEARRLSVDPAALLDVLNSTNFDKGAIRKFLDDSLGDAVHQVEVDSAKEEEEKPLLELYFTKGLRDKTVEAGKDFALTVEVSHANQEAEWALDGMDLIPENNDKYTFVSEGRVHVLLVHDTVSDDEGDYSCTIAGLSTSGFITVNGRKIFGFHFLLESNSYLFS